ncbi:MAG TPA: hypothetical protein EYP22_00745 [Methanosarcinales archaeon]|nr:hypothetical protein [Methanosarcinales archaeon]
MNDIPEEIIEFMSRGYGSSLVVRGSAGSGKTIFSLELMEKMTNLNPIYLSTRVYSDLLYKQFPRLEEKYKNNRSKKIIDASTIFLKTLSDTTDKLKLIQSAYELLKTIQTKKVSEINKSVLEFYGLSEDQTNLSELIEVCDIIKSNSHTEYLLVMDSIDGLCIKYRIKEEDLIELLNETFVEAADLKMIYVLEKRMETILDYLVDGVVTLDHGTIGHRIIREIELKKLRGVKIDQSKYLFTLNEGRFRGFEPFEPKYPKKHKKFEPVPDTAMYFSTGNKDLNYILGGGYPRGSFVFIEIGKNVDYEAFFTIIMLTAANFAVQGRPVGIIPVGGTNPKEVKDLVYLYGLIDELELFRTITEYDPTAQLDEDFVITYKHGDMKDCFDIWNTEISYLKKQTGENVLKIIGYDTMECLFGTDEIAEIIYSQKQKVLSEGDVIITIGRDSTPKTNRKLADASNIHLKLEKHNGTIILYGEKPSTKLYVLEMNVQKGYPDIDLIPIV